MDGIDELALHISEGDRLDFLREPSNPHDSQAIMVRTEGGAKIGYVPRADNVIFSRLMDAGKLLFARVTSCSRKGSWVKIEIKVFLHE